MKNKFVRFIVIFIAMLIFIFLAGRFYHGVVKKSALDKIEPYGELIDVNGEKMHIYTSGQGEETVILLPGHGVPLPSAEFGPLMRELEKDYKVVIIEPFGVGFSDDSQKPRSLENYTEEIRTVLKNANIEPPYILMPHSISGLYGEYYASTYPEEVKGLFLLDSTDSSDNSVSDDSSVEQFEYTLKLQKSGIQDLTMQSTTEEDFKEMKFPISKENGYTEKEISDYISYITFSVRDNIIDQLRNAKPSIETLMETPFPSTVPVFKVIYEDSEDFDKDMEHLKKLNSPDSYAEVGKSHFVYHGNTDKIKILLDDFIKNIR